MWQGLPGGSALKNPPDNAGDTGLILVWEDPTQQGAMKSMNHNYWVCALEAGDCDHWAHAPYSTQQQAGEAPLAATREKPMRQRRPSTANK